MSLAADATASLAMSAANLAAVSETDELPPTTVATVVEFPAANFAAASAADALKAAACASAVVFASASHWSVLLFPNVALPD